MRKLLLFMLLSAFAFQAQGQQGDPLEAIIAAEKAHWLNSHPAATDRDLPPFADNRSDILYCRAHWTVDPAVKYIQGSVMTRFRASEPVNSLEFDFSQALSMDSILYHGQKAAFTRNGDILTVQFPFQLSLAVDSLTFYYQGAPTSTGFGSFETNQHEGVPILWTLSQPYGAMEWWPCKQALTDKIDSIDVYITHPTGYKAASNGLLQSETTANGLVTAHWKHRYPIATYLVCMAVTNYTVFSIDVPFGATSTPLLNYVYPEALGNAQAGIQDHTEAMLLYNQLFGIYPFQNEKYGLTQFGWGGGMEHQTMTFVGGFSYDLLVHELAHQWFGDKITCGSWQDIWLNEGFATYLTGLCYNFLRPQYWSIYKAHHITKATEIPDGSVFVPDTSTVARVFSSQLSYSKGAMLLHMLRWKIGDNAFFAGVRNYINDPALEYRYAVTADLKAHLEAASGKNLDEFFADWFYGKGYPSYEVNWHKTLSNGVKITLIQKQSDPSVSFFEMPVPVRLTDGVHDTTLVLNHTSSGQVFFADLDFNPTELIFDPDMWLVSRNNLVQEVSATGEPLPAVSLDILPNPAFGDIALRVRADDGEKARVSIWSSEGKLVLEQEVDIYPGMNSIPVATAQLPSGRYALQLNGKRWRAERSLILY